MYTSFIDSQIKTGDVISISELIAYLHDIGKFTPAFAGRILESLPFIRQQLDSLNFDIPGSSFFLSNTPHALAGQCILHERNFPACLSIIVGAHHGAPQHKKRMAKFLVNKGKFAILN